MSLPALDILGDCAAVTEVGGASPAVDAGHRIQLDGSERSFVCAPGDTVLRAALRAGIGFPYECNSGGCGSCSFEPLAGEWQDGWPEAPGLGARAKQRGRRLACQTRPSSDGVVRIRQQDHCTSRFPPQRLHAHLVERRSLTHDMVEFGFHTEQPAQFLPGQFAMIDLPGVQGSRAYSMSNLANDDGLWSFVVKQMPGGRGSSALFERLAIGDTVTLDGPYGLSYLRPEAPRDLVCVAGGSGLSPVLSILAGAARDSNFAGRGLTLFYGGRTVADLCAESQVNRDARLEGRVHCISAVSDPAVTDWDGERGFIHEVVQRWLDSGREAKNYEWYFCGPPRMTDAVQSLLMLERKVPHSQIHYDRFV